MLSLLARHPGTNLYWLLTSKGYKTYRFMPVFFHEFHPCYAPNRRPLKTICCEAWPSAALEHVLTPPPEFCGPIRATNGCATGLRNWTTNGFVIRTWHFFRNGIRATPQGDELVCLARFHPDNLKPYIRRQL